MSIQGIHVEMQLGTLTPMRSQMTQQHVHTTTCRHMYMILGPYDYSQGMSNEADLIRCLACM